MSSGAIWIWLGIAIHAKWLSAASRRTRWIVISIATALWVYVTYFMPFVPPDDRPAIVFGIVLLGVMIGGVVAEAYVSFRQVLDWRRDKRAEEP